MRHTPVLLEEVMSYIPDGATTVIDCTIGDAGHAQALLERLPHINLVGMDADPDAVLRAREFLKPYGERVQLMCANFGTLADTAKQLDARAQFIVADLGWSSPQFAERGRGFSFNAPQEPLDMRFDPTSGQSAAAFLNTASEDELGNVLRLYGEEKKWRELTTDIIAARKKKKFERVSDLLEVVQRHKKAARLHPATLVMQALRIHVNSELANLEKLLAATLQVLAPGGRCAIITFHSLEDRIVKRFILTHRDRVEDLTSKVVTPQRDETVRNPRARSAKLRVYTLLS